MKITRTKDASNWANLDAIRPSQECLGSRAIPRNIRRYRGISWILESIHLSGRYMQIHYAQVILHLYANSCFLTIHQPSLKTPKMSSNHEYHICTRPRCLGLPSSSTSPQVKQELIDMYELTVLGAALFFLLSRQTAAHPACLYASRAPNTDTILQFCPQPADGACCNEFEEATAIATFVEAGDLSDECSEYYKQVRLFA